jgi:hypothetical protein
MSRTRDISNIYSSDDFSGAGNLVSIANNYTALEDDIIFVNTASTAITVTLPSSPSSGGKIKVLDVASNSQNNNITILGNTYNINSASAYVINTPDSSVDLIYINSNKGWIVSNEYITISKPGVPTGVSAIDVGTGRAYNNGAATVSFLPAISGDAAASYSVVSTPGSYTATGASSPIVVTGLQSNTSYTFKVFATNAAGNSAQSTASDAITATTIPEAPVITVDVGFKRLSVNYTAGATGGKAVSAYTATRTGAVTASGASPIIFDSLTGGTSYTISMTATNANGTSLQSNIETFAPWDATGGTITEGGIYRYHTFTSTSTFTSISGSGAKTIDYAVIGGGGGGGSGVGGGGGAGYLSSGSNYALSTGTNAYTVTIGGGGGGGGGDGNGGFGVASSIAGIATGARGGFGGGFEKSGSEGGGNMGTGGRGIGGGASGLNGGVGSTVLETTIGGGGGGGTNYSGFGVGGSSIGGNGGPHSTAGGSGAAGTGSGGGGGGAGKASGGSGSGGRVIIRYVM